MVFSSHLFCFYFLPLALAVYFALPRRAKNLGLTLASYVFYGWAHPAFVFLMLYSTAIDYVCGLAITHDGSSRRDTAGDTRTRAQRTWLVPKPIAWDDLPTWWDRVHQMRNPIRRDVR